MSDTIPRRSLVRTYLQKQSLAYKNSQYIAEMVAPLIDVASSKAKIWKYDKGSWFRDGAKVRAPGASPNVLSYHGTDVNIDTFTYEASRIVTDEDLVNAGLDSQTPPVEMKEEAIEFTTDKLLLKKEIIVSSLIQDTTWIDGNAGGVDAEGLWAPPGSTNTFLADMRTGQAAIRAATGFLPNSLMLDFGTWNLLKDVEEINDRLKNTSDKILTTGILARLIGIDNIYVGSAIKSTANENQAHTDFTAADIWDGDNAGKGIGFLFYAPKKPGLRTPSALYTPRKKVLTTGLYRASWEHAEPLNHRTTYQTMEDFGCVATGTDLGYKWTDTHAT